ncbi:hypothetical protein ACJRO7_033986 [Eucalyptus globulus]|uniref:Root meristem growth factor 9 n=1 Tax=Eucalyptus globulus TaxID=34317 RepID=A0ABD3J2B6_EUCGL
MAKLPCKHLVLMFVLLCFISITATARNLRESVGGEGTSHVETLEVKEGQPPDPNDLFSMDYTPAQKKPPIHNL